MMIPQMLTPELSRSFSVARSRARAPMAVLCVSLLGMAAACSGSFDDNQDAASSGPASSGTAAERGGGAATAPSPVGTSTGSAAGDNDPSNITTRERDTDDILGVSGGSRASGAGRRGGGSRASDAENTSDAGDVDAGDVDAGAADAGEVDAGLGDAGLGDAGAAAL
jgi:hypothetical protein